MASFVTSFSGLQVRQSSLHVSTRRLDVNVVRKPRRSRVIPLCVAGQPDLGKNEPLPSDSPKAPQELKSDGKDNIGQRNAYEAKKAMDEENEEKKEASRNAGDASAEGKKDN